MMEALANLDWRPVWLSLRVGLAATALSLAIGSALGHFLAHRHFRGKRAFEALVLLPLLLPPTVLGYYLLVVVGRRGAVGRAWESLFGEPLVFTLNAAIVAACASAIPIVARQMTAAFAALEPDVTDAARLDGAHGIALMWRVHLPQVRGALLAAGAIAFARSLGDFGATLMVAGNLPGRTQTAALAIYDLINQNRHEDALVLVIIMSAVAFAILLATTGGSRAK
jgi:molybdate transport system permease protein